ncbi:MAG: hypothetical protein OXG35_20465 [Acidobacteria bacterium]|nr:hypothetical protein [Acidobacteriota bacterium]
MMAKKRRRTEDGGREKPPATTLDPPRRDQTPIEVANEVVTRTRLTRVRFSRFSAQASLATDLENEVHLKASTHFSRPRVDSGDDGTDAGFSATSTLEFRLSKPAPSSDPNDEDEPCVVVRATLEASYAFKDDSPDFSEEQLKTFALHYCPFHVWGYWREFVHSSLARLEFPALTVPLFQIGMAQALVVDEMN